MSIVELTDLIETPVDIETFIKDPKYLGGVVGDGFYPYWLDKLKSIYLKPGVSPFCEVLLSGSIGAGRSLASIVGFLYELYILTLVKNPHDKWTLLPTTPIELAVIAGDVPSNLLADRILDCINLSPYFKAILQPNKGSRLESDMFPNHVGITFSSSDTVFLGKAIFSAIVDDSGCPTDPVLSKKYVETVTKLYTNTWRRSYSRFCVGGMLPFRMWVAVSNESPLYSLVKQRKEYNAGVFYVCPSIWEVQAFKNIYSGDTFSVFIGTKTEPPQIVKDINFLVTHKKNIIQVPVEYHPDFENNIVAALQDLAGIPMDSDERWNPNI